jgi:hypothetical protein
MSQSTEDIIYKFIKDNYLTSERVVSFLCVDPRERAFLDVFKTTNPRLYFLTIEDLLELSRKYVTNNNLQQTLKFIESKLKEYYNFVFNIWICFKFKIIEIIPDETTDPQIIQRSIKDFLPGQMITLLQYLFDFVFYETIIRPVGVKESTIQMNVVNIVLLYSKLFIFLQNPDPSLPFFTFNKRNISFTLLLNVMVYKYFDSLHKISSIIFDNYINVLKEMFGTFVSLFGDTPQSKEKIDFGLGHLAVFLLYQPNLSEILNTSSFVSRVLVDQFKQIDIFFFTAANGTKYISSLQKVEEDLKKKRKDITGYDIRKDLQFNPMSDNTFINASNLVSQVREKLNTKQNSSVSQDVLTPMIKDLKHKYELFKLRHDYFNFLYVLNGIVGNFVSTNSMSKKNKLMFCSDLSQCCIQVPNFELRTFEENTRINFLEEQKNKKKIEETEMEEQRRRESARRLDEIKSRQQKKENILKAQKAQKAQEAQEEKEAQEAAVAATPTDKEKDLLTQLTIERNKIFRKHVEPIFQQFSQAIRSGHYQDAAYMLNTKLTPKLYSRVPWTEANMKKFPTKVKEVYDELLDSASSAVESPPAIASSLEAPPSSLEATPPSLEATPPSLVATPPSLEATPPFPLTAVSDPKKDAKLIQFEQYIASLCDGNGAAYFEFMFRCTLKQFFRFSNFVKKTSDQDIIKMLSTLTPSPHSAASAAPPLTDYMNLQGRGQTSRALFGFALLNGLCRHEHVRIAFIGRTFIQLLACHSRLPPDKCIELRIPQETSDIDVCVIFNNDKDPMQYRSFVVHIFNLLWNIPETNIHIQWEKKKPTVPEEVLKQVNEHRREMETKKLLNASATRALADAAPPRPQRDMHDNSEWTSFKLSTKGQRMYESISRGSLETVKVFFNNEGVVGEVSDISFKTLEKIVETFKFIGIDPHKPDLKVLPLLELKYKPQSSLFDDGDRVYLEFEFPNAPSGLEECLTIIINILKSFLTNGFKFESREDFYFIHVSSLLKFIIRAIQYQGLHLFNQKGYEYDIRELYRQLILNLFRVLESRQDIRGGIEEIRHAALSIIDLFFISDKSNFNETRFDETTRYRNTEKNTKGARDRVDMDLHKIILDVLHKYGFDHGYLLRNKYLFGGTKYSRRHNRGNKPNSNNQDTRRRCHTKKNKKQKLRKTKRRNKNKIHIIKEKMKTSFKINKK